FEALDLSVVIAVAGVKAAPGAKTTAVAESQIAGFADLSSGFIVWRHGALENARRRRTIGLECRIAANVELPIYVELPMFAGDPGQHPRLDRAEIGPDQNMTGRGTDHSAREIAGDR